MAASVTRGQRTFERWRGENLEMGLLYGAEAEAFWRRIVEGSTAAEPPRGIDPA